MPDSELNRQFRKLDIYEKRKELERFAPDGASDLESTGESDALVQLSNVLIESAIGYFGVPLGIATGFRIDNNVYHIPLATEEPSVVAAATYAARIISSAGGFSSWSDEPVMTGSVYFPDHPGLFDRLCEMRRSIKGFLKEQFQRMQTRGGGYVSSDVLLVDQYIKVRFDVDVRDAMGANLINSAAEKLGRMLADKTGATPTISILTNAAISRLGGAQFSIDHRSIPANENFNSGDVCRRIVDAYEIAVADGERAVTHNKGIMNGISALALATGNDTRGVEASAHAWASRTGAYMPLSAYTYDEGVLTGTIRMPLPFATIGGAVSFHPGARAALEILGQPRAPELSRIAAAVGLAQNFAALLALVSGGIQKGHMRLHARRLAYDVGARNQDVETVADSIIRSGRIDRESAQKCFYTIPEHNDSEAKESGNA